METTFCFKFSKRQLEQIFKINVLFPCHQESEEGNGILPVNKYVSVTLKASLDQLASLHTNRRRQKTIWHLNFSHALRTLWGCWWLKSAVLGQNSTFQFRIKYFSWEKKMKVMLSLASLFCLRLLVKQGSHQPIEK